jgi:hypothetical protein
MMSELLNSGSSGHHNGIKSVYEVNKEIREQTMKKWGEAGFLYGLTGHVNTNLAQMLECCSSARLNEVDISGDTTNNTLPISMKVYAKTIENPDNK